MRVTIDWLRSLTLGVKVIAAALSMGVVAALLVTTTNIAAMRGRVDSFRPTQQAPKLTDMITYSHALPGGGTLTLTMTKPDGQSWEAFSAEAAAAWAAVKAANGI